MSRRADVSAPQGHAWHGIRVHVCGENGRQIATSIGTFTARDGKFTHALDAAVFLDLGAGHSGGR